MRYAFTKSDLASLKRQVEVGIEGEVRRLFVLQGGRRFLPIRGGDVDRAAFTKASHAHRTVLARCKGQVGSLAGFCSTVGIESVLDRRSARRPAEHQPGE